MTEADDRLDAGPLRPALKRPDRRADAPAPEAPAPEPDDADLERGRTLALVAALGRLQMSLDVLQRQQRAHAEAIEARLARIERALSDRPEVPRS